MEELMNLGVRVCKDTRSIHGLEYRGFDSKHMCVQALCGFQGFDGLYVWIPICIENIGSVFSAVLERFVYRHLTGDTFVSSRKASIPPPGPNWKYMVPGRRRSEGDIDSEEMDADSE
jgi:hypothetical protein